MSSTTPIIRAWPPDPPVPPVTYYVQAQPSSCGQVQVRLVNQRGAYVPGGCLLTISGAGIFRYGLVRKSIGLPLDERGRVVLDME